MPKQSVFDPCPYCHAKRLVKTGSPKGQHQGYLCRVCRKSFTPFGLEQKQRAERAIKLFREGALPHEVQRETGIGTKHLQTLQAQHAPQLPKQRGKPTHLADYLEQVQLRKLTRQERAAAAQWISARYAMELLGLSKQSITDLVQRGKLEGRKECKHLWVSLKSVKAYQPIKNKPSATKP